MSCWAVAKRVAPVFLASRVVVLVVGMTGALDIGTSPGVVTNFGTLVAVPSNHWDAGWYLAIAQHGYGASAQARAFFPLYPLLIWLFSHVFGFLASGVLISLVAFFLALILLYRLLLIDFSETVATATVALLAFSPVSFFFSAVYTESLFLLLSIACIYAARRERWLVAGLCGFAAALARNSGILLLAPLIVMFLYGPRAHEQAALPDWSFLRQRRWRVLVPRYRPDPRMLWLLLIPAGLAAFTLYLQLQYHDGFGWITAQNIWGHVTTFPAISFWEGFHEAARLFKDVILNPEGPDSTQGYAAVNAIFNFGAAVLGLVGVIGCLLTLPGYYTIYAMLAWLAPLSSPIYPGPWPDAYALGSIARFESVIFPFFIWLALYLSKKRWVAIGVGTSAAFLGLATVLFATGRWVG